MGDSERVAPWLVAAAVVMAGLVVGLRLIILLAETNSPGRLIGAVVATLLLPGIVGAVLAMRSPTAGVIAFTVAVTIVGLLLVGNRLREPSINLNSATAEQLNDLDTVEATADEESCIDDELGNGGLDTVDAIFNDPEASGSARRELTQAVLDCDSSHLLAEATANNLEAFLGDEVDIDDREAQCLVDHVVENGDDPARTLALGDRTEDIELVQEALERCLSEDDLAVIRGDPGTGPQAYGESADLDGLYDACRDGDDRACDLLFANSSAESEYSALGRDCAGRMVGQRLLCTPGVDMDEAGLVAADDPGLAQLVDDCASGDFIACDLAYLLAPLGSEAEQVGFTCGGRIAVGAIPDCRSRLD